MFLRDLVKCNSVNRGNRTLIESILVPEVAEAIKDWQENSGAGTLIGGLALSYYVKPRSTTDGDLLFLNAESIPAEVAGFKRTRPGAYQHNKTHVEIEVLIPTAINMSTELAKQIIDSATNRSGIMVASIQGLIASKLDRFKLQDQADIEALLELGEAQLDGFTLTEKMNLNWQKAQADFASR